jgi:glycerol-3-phosphate dehydrogenase
MVQGSHIVVKRLFTHDRAYIFQNADGRIIFAIPYQQDFTLIGTTDRDYKGDPAAVQATEDEIAYLIAAASASFKEQIRREDVVWSYSGVRPLYDDGASKAQEATRDYVLKLDAPIGQAPLLSIFGGKITTYRRLAEAVLARLESRFPQASARAGWTAHEPLPGGDFPVTRFDGLVDDLMHTYPDLEPSYLRRLARLYGTRARELLGSARRFSDLGQHFGATLTAREIDFLKQSEWARSADDVLWRRTKLGLTMTASERAAVAETFDG